MACEITVKVKDQHKTMTEKTTVYSHNVVADFTDGEIDRLVAKATKNFGGDALGAKVVVTIRLIEE